MAQRHETEGGYETEEDTRPGITPATQPCRNGASCRFLPHCHYSHACDGLEQYHDAREAAFKRLRTTGARITCGGYKVC